MSFTPTQDPYLNKETDYNSPVRRTRSFSKSDTVDMPSIGVGFHVNTSGLLNCIFMDDENPRILNVTAGMYYPYRLRRVLNTTTTAEIVIIG